MRIITGSFLLLIAGCAGRPDVPSEPAVPTATAEQPAVEEATPACRYDDPQKTYQIKDPEACLGPVIFCDTGYPFKDDCGCGCATTPVFPEGHDPLACAADADCAISYKRANNCCGDLCTATQPYNIASVKLLDTWHAAHCADAVCPIAGCIGGGPTFTPHCDAGQCKAVMHPAERRR